MVEFDYKLDYKNTLFRPNDNRYRIGRGEQGVLLVRPYTDVICRHWRFKTLKEAKVSSQKIFDMYLDYRIQKDFVGMDMCRKFLEMGLQEPEDMQIIKTEKSMVKMERYYHKKKTGRQVKRQRQPLDLNNLEI